MEFEDLDLNVYILSTCVPWVKYHASSYFWIFPPAVGGSSALLIDMLGWTQVEQMA